MEAACSRIKSIQRRWADMHGLSIHKNGYTSTLSDNLFFPLQIQTVKDFEHGDGNETKPVDGKPAKMCALHSSSALVVNVFDYWRDKDATPLAKALGVVSPIVIEGFEMKFPTGLPGHAPNLDVVIQSPSGKVAIESKFTEPYYKAKSNDKPFKDKYFPSNYKLWLELGLPECEQLAMDIQSGHTVFSMLDATQLLKHILGLQKSLDKPHLLYLWYSVSGEESEKHQEEVPLFAKRVDTHIAFRSMTYQQLFSRLLEVASHEHQDYLHSLESRYFTSEDELATVG